MSEPTHVIKLAVEVYCYVAEDGTVTQVVVWDQTAKPASVHLYDPHPQRDDAGAELPMEGDEAARVIAAADAEQRDWPGWDFGC